jgi:hypothetical protein
VSAVSVEASNSTVISHVYRLRLAYDGDASGAPATLFLKTRHLERKHGAGPGGDAGGHHEVEFYRRLAHTAAPDILVHCLDAHRDEATGDWHLLLEDLKDTRAMPSQWPFPPNLADCETIIRALARFHAA